MAFSFDQHGFLANPTLHDGFVDGLLLEDEKRATVLLRTVGGEKFKMQLNGVEAFVCDDFRQGNIILHIQIFSGIAPDDNSLGRLYGPPHPSAAQEYHDRYKLLLTQKIEKIKEGLLSLVAIDPSYGCDLRAICQEVIITAYR
jgi:hypothetical protein